MMCNRENRKVWDQKYREAHLEERRTKDREYKRRSQKVVCACGKELIERNLKHHELSKTHVSYVKSQTETK